jgi:hypothetical protein
MVDTDRKDANREGGRRRILRMQLRKLFFCVPSTGELTQKGNTLVILPLAPFSAMIEG